MDNSKASQLAAINAEVEHCRKCPLYRNTTHGVPGAGNPDADIVFIGEAPGFNEDQQGLPFVGRAGQLLNKSLLTIKLKREDVFIANVIKHRPPENRDPLPAELAACRPYLLKQLQIIDPTVVVTLGRFSMNLFLPEAKISRDHGHPRWVNWQGKKLLIVPFFHPAAALRNPGVLRDFNQDFQRLPDIIASLKAELLPPVEVADPPDQDGNSQLPPADQIELL